MLALVPVPLDYLEGSRGFWGPFVLSIAERAKNDPLEMERMLFAGEAQAFIVWEPEIKKPMAFLAVRYMRRADGRVAELIWLMGENRKAWVHLIDDLKTYLREQQGCISIRPICRPGWLKVLKPLGFRLTHVVLEQDL